MEIDIEEFDQVNYAHLRDANNLLDLIIDENGYEFELVLDIGCGSGRVTSLIDCRLRCNQILGLDIDMKAIKYAQVNFGSPRIRYQVQDISLPWEQLDESIRKLEGKVDLIVSNRVLHWIEDQQQAIENMYRLMKKDAMFYANVTTLYELFKDIDEDEKAKYSKIIYIPNEKEQIDELQSLLMKNKFHLITVQSCHLQQLYPSDEFKNVVLPYFPNLTKKYLLEKDPVERNKIMNSGLRDFIKKTFLKHYCREVTDETEGSKFELTYGQIRMVAQK